ncbi:MAG: alpha/beta hydrolase [Betaproteobacteria bacterium RIFCSPLOWO2_12_FULL_65_14]|nr:MAG: alpha/beta hydrolase [Betaproteobacteria bacterium RIFCSPLOWO2_12_FULL_65_14]
MRASTRREFVPGPAGRIECAVDAPEAASRGTALIAHPHPLYGGSLDNKVVQTLARAFIELGYETWRPNFRGVGATEGVHDEGRGELEDLHAIVDHLQAERLVLAGFSFGAALQAQLSRKLSIERLVLVGVAVTRLEVPQVARDSLVIHGENDETVPLAAVLDWARPQELPVVLVPGADHFFHRKLHVLRGVVQSNWR